MAPKETRPTTTTDVATLQREMKAMRRIIEALQNALIITPMRFGPPDGRLAVVDADGNEVGQVGWVGGVLTLSLPGVTTVNLGNATIQGGKIQTAGGVAMALDIRNDGSYYLKLDF